MVSRRRAKKLIETHMLANGMFAKGWSYTFERDLKADAVAKRAKKIIAVCDYENKVLRFHPAAFGFGVMPEEFEQTILHEVAHYYVQYQGHTQEWYDRAYALGYTEPFVEREAQ